MALKNILVHIFWIIVVFYLDPGGYLNSLLSPLQHNVLRFAMVVGVLFMTYHLYSDSLLTSEIKRASRIYFRFMLLWLIYFYFVYLKIQNSESIKDLLAWIIGTSNLIFNVIIVFPIIFFATFSLEVFFKYLVYSSIIIGTLFIATVLSGFDFMETWEAKRRGGMNRQFMHGYGLMNFIIPLTISMFMLKVKIDKRVLLSFLIVLATIGITIFRRDIIGVVEFWILLSIMFGYLERKNLLLWIKKFVNIRRLVILSFAGVVLFVFASNFTNKVSFLVVGTLGSLGLIESNESVSNTDSARLSLSAKEGITDVIKKNFFFGVGYSPDWYSGDGGEKGWEGSDYVFLASFAMYGLIGLMLFVPFYAIFLTFTFRFLRFVRSKLKSELISSQMALIIVVGISAGSEIFKNLIEYPNWFFPIGAINTNTKYFIFLGLLLGTYNSLKLAELSSKISYEKN